MNDFTLDDMVICSTHESEDDNIYRLHSEGFQLKIVKKVSGGDKRFKDEDGNTYIAQPRTYPIAKDKNSHRHMFRAIDKSHYDELHKLLVLGEEIAVIAYNPNTMSIDGKIILHKDHIMRNYSNICFENGIEINEYLNVGIRTYSNLYINSALALQPTYVDKCLKRELEAHEEMKRLNALLNIACDVKFKRDNLPLAEIKKRTRSY